MGVIDELWTLAARFPHLVDEWDEEANLSLTPQMVSAGSRFVVWWRCKSGHRWEARIASRSSGHGCPYCTNRRIWPGTAEQGGNSLAALNPELADEWDHAVNGNLAPEDVVPGSTRRVGWTCPDGHRWVTAIVNRTKAGSGCPICTGQRRA